MSTALPAFDSERLHIFAFELIISEMNCCKRTLFVGYPKGDEHPAHIATLTLINPLEHLGPANAFVDWVQVVDRERRKGYATEFCRAIEKHTSWELHMDGASPEGDAFCDSYYAKATSQS